MWIYTKIELQMTENIGEYLILHEDGFEDSRPVAQCCGASSQQKQTYNQQDAFYQAMTNQQSKIFAMDQKVYNQITSEFTPIFNAGPNQAGFSTDELNVLNSNAITSTGQNYQKAARAVNEELAAQGGGNTYIGSGTNDVIKAQVAQSSAALTSEEQNQILQNSYSEGHQNWLTAANALMGAGSVFGSSTNQAGAANTAGSGAAQTANEITQANNSWIGAVTGLVGGLGSAAITSFCPAEGSLYLMADGSEKPVEQLLVGDLIQGIDDEPQTIEEIQSSLSHIVLVVTDNGRVMRNSPTHAYALPKGGFTVATRSLGKTIVTSTGNSKVISVEPAGKAWVFNIMTNGSHTYRADGVWSLGVGDAERQIGMNEWSLIGDRLMSEVA